MTIRTAYRSIRKKGIKKYIKDYIRSSKKKKYRLSINDRINAMLESAKTLIEDMGVDKEKGISACLELSDFAAKERKVLTYPELMTCCRAASEFVSKHYDDLSDNNPDELKTIMNNLWEVEKDKPYNKHIKQYYLKEVYPDIYSHYASAPIENKVIVFESGFSPSPSSKHLADVIAEQGKYKIVYIGLKIRAVPMGVFYENGKRFIEELATAKALFLSTANDLISQFDLREETNVIQLWHGVGAFKHVGYSTVNNKNFGRTQKTWDEYDSFRNYTALTIAAEGQRWIFEESTKLNSEVIRPIGISRTDLFYDKNYKENAYNKLKERFPQIGERKLILYGPTFRGIVSKAKAPDKLDVRVMAEKLSDDYVLLIKHHGLSKDIPPIPEDLENTFAFDLNKNNVLNIDELLVIADCLITDYSSVAFEYAITERPIIFFTYDLEDYIEQRGLYFDFEKDAPGPICRDTESIVDYLANIDNNFDKDKLIAFKTQYVEACDGHATERTIALIEE